MNLLRHMRELAGATWRLRPHLRGGRYLVAAVVLSSVLAAMLEGVGVGLLVPLLNLLMDGIQPKPMRPVDMLKAALPHHGPTYYVLLFCLFILLAIMAKNMVFYCSQMLAAKLRRRISMNLRQSLFERLHNAELHLFEQRSGGELANIFSTEVSRTLGTVELVINLLQRISIGLIYASGLFYISWQLTVVTLGLAVLIGITISFLYRRLARVGQEITELNQRITTTLMESFAGVRVVRATHSQQQEIARFRKSNEEQAQVEEKIARSSSLLMPLAETVAVAGAMLMIGSAYVLFVRTGQMRSSYLMVFGFILLRLLPLINQVYSMQGHFFHMAFGVREVEKWLESPQFPRRPFGQIAFTGIQKGICFENVGYTYANGTEALREITFEIPAGKTVALVGSSGSGKSTVAGLLLRFRQSTAGRVTVDGRDYWEFTPESWHRAVAVVDQDAFLFHDTLARNIAYGFPDATPEAIAAAVKIAQLADVVEALPAGLETIVGERGTLLSGGQRQRLAIARALVRSPQLLILDEATSALDNISERQVQLALEEAQAGRTVLVIAHRLTTIQRADHIVVLDQGRVVQQGTWDELSVRPGAFARLLAAAAGSPGHTV